jgi:hypothetical protein
LFSQLKIYKQKSFQLMKAFLFIHNNGYFLVTNKYI